MTRREFMDTLEKLLQDVAVEDRVDALQYYEDYFEDAGYEKEADIIEELKSPENVASIIKKDLGIDTGSSNTSGYKDYRNEYVNYSDQTNVNPEKPVKNKIDKKLLIILMICAIPFVIGPVLGFGGALFGIIVGVFAATFGLYAGAVGCTIGAVALLASGVFAEAALVFGIGMILLSVAFLLTIVCKVFCTVIVPSVFNGIKTLFSSLFGKEEAVV